MKLNKRSFILIICSVMFLFVGCHRGKKVVPESMVTGHATIAADEALMPVMNAELDVFHSIYNFSSIECKYVSEYDAVNLLLQEKIRLAIITRPLNQKDNDYFKSKKIIPESIPLAYDAIAVIVNSENKTDVITTKQVSQILSGVITNWNQLTNSGKEGNIRQVFDAESSGIIRSLNDSLQLNKKISGDIQFAGSNKKIIEMVAADSNGIGFVGLNWLSENESPKVQEYLKRVKFVAVSISSNIDSINGLKPSPKNIFDLRYPLIRRVYAIYTDPSASLARGFLAHLTSDRGQKIIYRIGLKPEFDFQRLVKINADY